MMPEGRINVFIGCQSDINCKALCDFLPDSTRPAFEEDCSNELLQKNYDVLELIEPPEAIHRVSQNGLILKYDGLELEELADVEDKTVREYLQSLFEQLNLVGVDEFITAFDTLEGYVFYERYHLDSDIESLDERNIKDIYGRPSNVK